MKTVVLMRKMMMRRRKRRQAVVRMARKVIQRTMRALMLKKRLW